MEIYLNERIHLDGTDWLPNSQVAILDNINELISVLIVFNYHLEFTLFYSGSGFSQLIANLHLLDAVNDYALTNPISQLEIIMMEVAAKNWDEDMRQQTNVSYYHQLAGGAASYSVSDTTLAEVCERKFNQEIVAILNLIAADFNNTNPVYITRSEINPPNNMTLHPIPVLSTKIGVVAFMKANRHPPRFFNWNKKHGENGSGVRAFKDEIVSPLLGSRQEAADILVDAVGKRGKNDLWGYDTTRDKYIEFKCDGGVGVKSYHGYHPINQDEIDGDVKAFLRE